MLSYFNLNERSENANQNRAKNIRAAAPEPSAVSLSAFQQIFMYFGVVIGVIFSSTVNLYNQTGTVTFNLPLVQIGISFIVALVIVPQVYEKLSVRVDSPLIVQFGFFVMNGISWQGLFGTAAKAMGA